MELGEILDVRRCDDYDTIFAFLFCLTLYLFVGWTMGGTGGSAYIIAWRLLISEMP
jgi:hypothetical protein